MKYPFEAVAIRYVHDVLTAEFVNVGVVVVCQAMGYVGARFITHWSRVTAAFPSAELPHLRRIAAEIESACDQARARGVQIQVEPQSVVRFLGSVVSADDAGIQLSPVVRGITEDPDRTLRELHKRYAEHYLAEERERPLRNENDIWMTFARKLANRLDVNQNLSSITLKSPKSPGFQYDFERAWKNGKWNIAQPVSFDMRDPKNIKEKAAHWVGRVITLHPSEQNALIMFLVGLPPEQVSREVLEAASDALQILRENLGGEAEVLTEDRGEELAERIQRDLTHTH
jgi:Protein of unknown function (DUF3037)